jgi:hypothetical protein
VPLWLVLIALALWPVAVAAGLGVFVIRKARRWRLPIAVTELGLGAHRVLVVRTDLELPNTQALENLHGVLVALFASKGVHVPILLFDRHLDFSVAGQGVADARQKVPA